MSKVKIQGNASGTGVLTVTAPNTSTDRTITLPDSTGELLSTAGGTMTGMLDIATSNNATQIRLGDATSDTNKDSWIVSRNHTASEEDTALIHARCGDSEASLYLGGTDAFNTQNAVTNIRFLTAANTTTLNGTERMRVTNNGLTFNGDTAAANALDDYETGVYQYTITGSTGGSMTPKSGYEYFSYTKIGRQVTVIGKFETSGSHNATGYLKWSLPFAVGNFADQSESGAGTIFLYRTGLANVYNPTLVSSAGFSFFYSYYNTISNNEVNTLDGGNVDSTIEGFVHFTYFTD